uniref:DNA-directed RNA polymerase RpoA/D/Rpb3-type domain-containing protein n=1 Tax=viral metagenome TaxID=1070528 RepID=A0A6C0EQK0_9ZZZZ
MNPHIELNSNKSGSDILAFTLSGVNVSVANAIRRTALSDIPLIVFRTAPYENNKANIITNTTRLNNEILKQRLSCIPIYIKDLDDFPYKNYVVEVNVENITDTTMYVTTENFVIRDVVTGQLLSESKTREIFPPDDYTGDFIDFVRLRPKVFEDLPNSKIQGEKIHLTCELDIGNAKEDGMFNAVSTCSYGFTIDETARDNVLQKKKQTWKDEGKSEKEIDFEAKNWLLLDGMRIYKKDSFDFIIQTSSVYTNYEIVDKSCDILITKLDELDNLLEKDELQINTSQNTMANCFDVILENEDYTIGKVIEYFLYSKFYETKILTFCGFKKMHPHDNESIIRVAYSEAVEKTTVKGHLKECIEDAKLIYNKIRKGLLQLVKN